MGGWGLEGQEASCQLPLTVGGTGAEGGGVRQMQREEGGTGGG